jgi:NAD(P)-dependent dehydrogenase (short-subunit alcohol dehydrogenase family)
MNAIITGAASGIGRAVAQRLAADAVGRSQTGAFLLVDRDADGLAAAGDGLARDGITAHRVTADLSLPDVGTTVAAAAREHLDTVDALISNAGIVAAGELRDVGVETWDREFAVNVRATWLLGQALHPLLADGGGAIVATASIAATTPSPHMGAYSPSKAALVMLIRQMAFEWGPDGIRACCVSPGTVHTGMTDQTYSDPEKRAERASHLPLRRVADPEDIAAAVAYLAGPDAGYVTGVDLLVDGGLNTALLPAVRGLTPP